MKLTRLTEFFWALILIWAGLYLAANFIVPDHWILDYKTLSAEDVCRDDRQQLFGERWAITTMHSGGVDMLWSYEESRYVDRFEWDGKYEKGLTSNGWKTVVTSPAGEYRWDAVLLEVQLPLFIKVHIEDVQSNDFTVLECK